VLHAEVFAPADQALAYAAYEAWLRDDATELLHAAVERALPFVGIAYRCIVKARPPIAFLPDDERDELLSLGVVEVFNRVRSRREITYDAAVGYERYLVSSARRAMEAWQPLKPQIFDYAEMAQLPTVGRVERIRDIEMRLYLRRLPAALLAYYRRHTRLTPPEAGEYVLARLLRARPISLTHLARRFGLASPQFAVDHTVVLVRRCLYELRDEIEDGHVVEDWHDVSALYYPTFEYCDDSFAERARAQA